MSPILDVVAAQQFMEIGLVVAAQQFMEIGLDSWSVKGLGAAVRSVLAMTFHEKTWGESKSALIHVSTL